MSWSTSLHLIMYQDCNYVQTKITPAIDVSKKPLQIHFWHATHAVPFCACIVSSQFAPIIYCSKQQISLSLHRTIFVVVFLCSVAKTIERICTLLWNDQASVIRHDENDNNVELFICVILIERKVVGAFPHCLIRKSGVSSSIKWWV